MLSKILKAALLIFAGVDFCEADIINKRAQPLPDLLGPPSKCQYGETFDDRQGKCVDICLTKNCDPGYCYKGECYRYSDRCRHNGQCSKSQICRDQVCVPGCSSVKCPNGQTCLHGQCMLITQCKDPRPNDSTCPQSTSLRASPVCIKDQSEKQREYGKECEICKDKSVQEYRKVECRPSIFY